MKTQGIQRVLELFGLPEGSIFGSKNGPEMSPNRGGGVISAPPGPAASSEILRIRGGGVNRGGGHFLLL